MPNGRSYKSDESFLEKISIGATGTRFVFSDLKSQGHQPIELERGSRSFKIWKDIKIKRVRVPDILCIDCGRRIESRAKTKLEISMSHSTSNAERGWDSGLNNEDYVAFVRCSKIGERPIDWTAVAPAYYVAVREMRKAYKSKQVIQEKPKGAQEGFEIRLKWPSVVAKANGTIAAVSDSRVQYKRGIDDRTISVRLKQKGIDLRPLIITGEIVNEGQFLASAVSVHREFACDKDKTYKDYVKLLKSPSVSDRYSAAKALSHYDSKDSADALRDKIADARDHIYVRLEAAASLMRRGQKEGIEFLTQIVHDEYLENRLEGVIILGEISKGDSAKLLQEVLLDREQHPEIRAGAAWALGELCKPETLDSLVRAFVGVEKSIQIEAARALAKIAESHSEKVMNLFADATGEQRAGIAWALTKRGSIGMDRILDNMVDDDSRQWLAYLIGSRKPEEYVSEIEKLKRKDPEVYFAVTVLWKIISSWVYGLEEY